MDGDQGKHDQAGRLLGSKRDPKSGGIDAGHDEADVNGESQRKLARSLNEITNSVPVGIYAMALEPGEDVATLVFMNKKFIEISGLSEDKVPTDPLMAFACVHPDDYDDWVEKIAHAFVHKMPFQDEARLIVDGQIRWVMTEAVPRLTQYGKWIWEGVMQDITSQKINEQMPRRANQTLLEAASEKAPVAEGVVPLRDILDGFGNTLAFGKMRLRDGDIPATEALEVIEDCLADLRIVINTLDAEGESLWSVLGSLLERSAGRARHLSLDLTWDLDASRRIYLSPPQILQVARIVQEAVANAIRHSGAQAIQVMCTAGERGDVWQIEICDNGRGFDPDARHNGRGLESMHQRARAEGWRFHLLADRDGRGTQVTLKSGEDR